MNESKEPYSQIIHENAEDFIDSCIHEGRSFAQPDIFILKIDGERIVLKCFRRRAWLVQWWGRFIIRREYRMYRELQGIEGIPKVYRLLKNGGFLMELIEGDRMPHRRRDMPLEQAFFERLEHLMNQMHDRGLTHGDIRRKNILVCGKEGEAQKPFLIDFATACCYGKSSRRWKRRLFEKLKTNDLLTLRKLKAFYRIEDLSPEEKAQLENLPLNLKIGRYLKKNIYRKLKPRRFKRTMLQLLGIKKKKKKKTK